MKDEKIAYKISLFNIHLNNIKQDDLLRQLTDGIFITPNVDHIIKLQKDRLFYDIYQNVDWIVCDSKIVQLGLTFLGKPVKEVIPGSSFFSAYYQHHKDNDQIRIFLLGAAEGIARKAQEEINKKVGRNMVVASHSPSFGFENDEQECEEILSLINTSDATVLVVGVGAPKQEKWIYKYKDRLSNIKLFMALGATIDFEAGTLKRAPVWMQKMSLEWAYRLFKEPKRLWKRYMIDDLPFLGLILKEKLKIYRNPFEEKK
ncbi:WecB/TagA/CpsF family glycosyltransferase [Sphingobacterium sp. SGR-19]|uniref:WecB/TagA/CpsF family glycosyltransferase n=1 Tax=Sphingobacterium sp. SGR-19 TaxID=2710886 RepID=UPI0013EBDDA8|nr:WecB/TagA/CpsF family glycosyltransferase [Sphingobacterium sp. SGR-19]NGM67251.1 WecB/TagA/CpsF family glycosyltransferase [Sphingobacterium sp. SGR-19]